MDRQRTMLASDVSEPRETQMHCRLHNLAFFVEAKGAAPALPVIGEAVKARATNLPTNIVAAALRVSRQAVIS